MLRKKAQNVMGVAIVIFFWGGFFGKAVHSATDIYN